MSKSGSPRFRKILDRISYRDWSFDLVPLGLDPETGPVDALRILFTDPKTGDEWTGRKWYLSPHMTDSEVLQTALLAVLQAEEHEARERFQVDGLAIYGPHLSADALARVSGELDVRGDNHYRGDT